MAPKEEKAAKEKEARAASLFNQADPVEQAERERGKKLSDEEKERIRQAAERAGELGIY